MPALPLARQQGPTDHRRRLARAAGLAALFVLVSVFMAFPDVSRLGSHTFSNLGDPLLTQWTLRWEVHALATQPGEVFDANIFWPHGNALTYSETLLAAAPLAAGLAPVFGWPLTFNVLYLACWVASLVATFFLARWFRMGTGAAVLAALVFTFAAPRMANYGHFQLGAAFLLPLGVLAVLRFLEDRMWRHAAAVGVVGAVTFLMAVYYALVLAVTCALIVGGWLLADRRRPDRRIVGGLVLAALLAAVVAGPVASMYLRHRAEVNPTPDPIRLGDVLAPAEGSYLHRALDTRAEERAYNHRLFPGLLAAALAVVGVVELRRRRGLGGDARRRLALTLILAASAAMFVLGLGRSRIVAGERLYLPWRLVESLPPFDSVRALTRFSVVPLLGLALLAATGFERIMAGRSRRFAVAATVIVGLVMLAEYKIPIQTSARVDRPELTAVNMALRQLPPGAVVELPIADPTQATWGYTEAPRMVLSTIDWHPRVNGYAGYSPPGYVRTTEVLRRLGERASSTTEALHLIDALGVRYLVLRTSPMDAQFDLPGTTHYEPAMAQRVVDALPAERVQTISHEGDAILVVLRAAETIGAHR